MRIKSLVSISDKTKGVSPRLHGDHRDAKPVDGEVKGQNHHLEYYSRDSLLFLQVVKRKYIKP